MSFCLHSMLRALRTSQKPFPCRTSPYKSEERALPSYYRGTKYSIADMQGFLRDAGWPENLIVTMGAIGQAESSGYSGALADYRDHHPPEYSVGCWQINLLAHDYTEAQMSDPLANAQAALE